MSTGGKLDIDKIRSRKGAVNLFTLFSIMFEPLIPETLNHHKVKNLMNSNEKFDVVIVSEFLTGVFRAFAYHFDASLIIFANSGVMTWYYDEIGNIVLPSVEPVLSMERPYGMNFWQRLDNTIEKVQSIRWQQSHYVKQNKIIQTYFPGAPSVQEISRNVSLVLINTDYSTDVSRPLLPNMIPIGGFHLKPIKKLPEDLQQLMDNAKDGVIYFCFGSVIDPELIPMKKLMEVLTVLSKRKELVLWKFGSELPGLPKNVIIKKWLPQQDILGKFLVILLLF